MLITHEPSNNIIMSTCYIDTIESMIRHENLGERQPSKYYQKTFIFEDITSFNREDEESPD